MLYVYMHAIHSHATGGLQPHVSVLASLVDKDLLQVAKQHLQLLTLSREWTPKVIS